MKLTYPVVPGQVPAQVVDTPGEDAGSAVGARDTTIVLAEVVENVVDFAARQVPGVHDAHTDVTHPAAALVQENNRDDAGGVPTSSNGQVAEVKIDLCIEYRFAVRPVTQNVRHVVVLALRNLLDLEVSSVDIVVREICFDHDDSSHDHATE